MPRKPTGRKPGRPRVDPSAPAVTLLDNKTARLGMPRWWFAAAHLEAEWRVAGTWRHGRLKDLARHFTADPKRDPGRSQAAVTKMRADPRYQRLVSSLVAQLDLIRRQKEADPEGARLHRAAIRQAIEVAWEAEERRLAGEEAGGEGFGKVLSGALAAPRR